MGEARVLTWDFVGCAVGVGLVFEGGVVKFRLGCLVGATVKVASPGEWWLRRR
ncbi:MAG: hypothetical protein AAGC74_12115 [Verrucomicrobiota bacterium]